MRLLSSQSCPTSPPSPLRKATPNWLQHFDDCIVDGNIRPRLGSDDSEKLMHVLHGVAVAIGSRPLESPGSLYVTTRRVIWLSDADRGKGYAVDFLSLSLHAVSRDREAYPFSCIYTQIETGDEDDEEESEDSYSEINGDLVLSKITEMRLVLSDAGKYFDCLLIKSSQRDHRFYIDDILSIGLLHYLIYFHLIMQELEGNTEFER
ncbi:hypothetical protein ZIOFF_024203 [Zingiber officinale]|uniref:Chloride conductance regulatory protein ICln n=1 Tax=Zingiber officinale TaxID=94328 RepID=A0A8J5H005_ZINOF|nr:hypothetical protein ZIOFF_024203 [Zingiber officinale]